MASAERFKRDGETVRATRLELLRGAARALRGA
jgi:hypothetical protein